MFPWLKQKSTLAAILTAYTVTLAGFAYANSQRNDGHLIYTLDDAYIHMAIAKNVAQYGVFGITPYEFSATSSSPLWTLLLAGCYALFGLSEWTPFILNWLCGIGVILVIENIGSRAGITGGRRGVLAGAILVFVPILPIAFTGMEHLLHIAAILSMVYFLWRILRREEPHGWREWLGLGVCTAIAVGSRFETLFLVAAATLILSVRREWKGIFACGIGAMIPFCGFGIYSMLHGWNFLPNSLLLKGNTPQVDGLGGMVAALGGDALRQLLDNLHLCVLFAALIFAIWRNVSNKRGMKARNLILIIVLIAGTLHLQLAKTGWFYRYEAYLVGLSLMVLAMQFPAKNNAPMRSEHRRYSGKVWAGLVITLILGLTPLVQRSVEAHLNILKASRNIYQQQYQTGRFISKFYDREAVAANDIGAINYLASPRCIDLWGLGTYETMRQMIAGTYSTEAIRTLARECDVRIAVVYTSWFQGETALPREWTEVGTLTISNNVICGDETVTFLAVDPSEIDPLRKNLKSFVPELPEGVIWKETLSPEMTVRYEE